MLSLLEVIVEHCEQLTRTCLRIRVGLFCVIMFSECLRTGSTVVLVGRCSTSCCGHEVVRISEWVKRVTRGALVARSFGWQKFVGQIGNHLHLCYERLEIRSIRMSIGGSLCLLNFGICISTMLCTDENYCWAYSKNSLFRSTLIKVQTLQVR